jgi:hypothetical protein
MNTTADKETRNQDQIKVGHDEIAQRACQLWETAGQPVGRDAEYWLQAEAELLGVTQRGRSPEAGARRQVGSAKQPGRSPRPFQQMKPAQKQFLYGSKPPGDK